MKTTRRKLIASAGALAAFPNAALAQFFSMPLNLPTPRIGYALHLINPVTFKDVFYLTMINSQLYAVEQLNMQTLVCQAGPAGSDARVNNSRFRPAISRFLADGQLDTSWGAFGTAILEDYNLVSFSLSTLSWSGGIVTATASATLTPNGNGPCPINNGAMDVIVTGASPSAYNGRFSGAVTGTKTFTYSLTNNPGAETSPGFWERNKIPEMLADNVGIDPFGHFYMPFARTFAQFNSNDWGLVKFKPDGTVDESWGFIKSGSNQPHAAYGVWYSSANGDGSDAFGSKLSTPVAALGFDNTGSLNANGNVYVSFNDLVQGGNPIVYGFAPTSTFIMNWETFWFPSMSNSGCVVDAQGRIVVAGSTASGFAAFRIDRVNGSAGGNGLDNGTDTTFGPSLSIAAMSWASNTVSFTTSSAHGLTPTGVANGALRVQGVTPAGFNGTNFHGTAINASVIAFSLGTNPSATVSVQGTYQTGLTTVSIGQSGIGVVSNVMLDASNNIIVAGSRPDTGASSSSGAFARFTSIGILDTTFGTNGTLLNFSGTGQSGLQNADQAYRGAFRDNSGNLLQAVRTTSSVGSYFGPIAEWAMSRYNSAGVLDTTFNATGHEAFGNTFWSALNNDTSSVAWLGSACVDTNGEYYVGGHIAGHTLNTPTNVTEAAIIKLKNAGGAVDPSWGMYNNAAGRTASFQGAVTPPTIVTNGVNNIGQTTATANAFITPNGNPAVNWMFMYGLSSGLYHFKSPIATIGSSPQAASINLTGLTSGVTYYGRAVAYSPISGAAYDASPTEVSFSTSIGGQGVLFADSFHDTNGTQLIGYHLPDTNVVGNNWRTQVVASDLVSCVISNNRLINDHNASQNVNTFLIDTRASDQQIVQGVFLWNGLGGNNSQDFEVFMCSDFGGGGGNGYMAIAREGSLQLYKDGVNLLQASLANYPASSSMTLQMVMQRPNLIITATGVNNASISYSGVNTDSTLTVAGINLWPNSNCCGFTIRNAV